MLRLLLQTDEDQYWHSKHHAEYDARTITVMRFDSSVGNNHLDATHIDFKFGEATSSERIILFKHV